MCAAALFRTVAAAVLSTHPPEKMTELWVYRHLHDILSGAERDKACGQVILCACTCKLYSKFGCLTIAAASIFLGEALA